MRSATKAHWKSHHKTDSYCDNRFMITGISEINGRIAHVADDVVVHNVDLICAAPDLLAALQLVASEVTDGVRPTSADSFLPADIVAAVQAAITKATGSAA